MSDVIYNQIKAMASQLTPSEKARLADWLETMAEVESHDPEIQPKTLRLADLYGAWPDVRVTDTDIHDARRDMLANFPDEDI